ncbi:nucleotide exchange factor GrpE [Streptomyces sp. 4N509B]|uniref:nucleotide exchange factor GrpE n=1 Tax=Streptomyces sp. 4N509B TaxID=3457413 RepID=UPI003FD3D813
MTQDPQGFDKKPEGPDAEAASPDAPAETAGETPAADGAAAGGGTSGAGSGSGGGGGAGAGENGPSGASGDVQQVALTAQLDQTRTALNERTQDLQRLQAEFQNYRRRVERDRVAVREVAVANLLTELLPVLDDIGRARDHGELVGGFKQVAESLETVAAKMGLMQFGKEGEPFDPTIHEALMHSYSPDVTETTCVQILQPGYRIGDRTIRPARVGVAEPQPGAQRAEEAEGSEAAEGEKEPGEEQHAREARTAEGESEPKENGGSGPDEG